MLGVAKRHPGGGGGVTQGLGISLFAFGGAHWPLATAHCDPRWARTCPPPPRAPHVSAGTSPWNRHQPPRPLMKGAIGGMHGERDPFNSVVHEVHRAPTPNDDPLWQSPWKVLNVRHPTPGTAASPGSFLEGSDNLARLMLPSHDPVNSGSEAWGRAGVAQSS